MQTDAMTAQNIVRRFGRMILDSWNNFFTGLGTIADQSKQTKNRTGGILSDDELEDIFIDDGLGANIVKAIPDDMFREGWEYEFPDDDEIKARELADEYDAIFENIDALSKIKKAFYWARLYGGAVIVIGALDGRKLEAPLNPKSIRTDGLEYLRVVDRSDITFHKITWQLDPYKPRYGLPEFYPIKSPSMNGSGVSEENMVHYSRVIEIHGEPIPDGATRYTAEQRYWGLSVIQNVYDYFKSVGSSIGSVSHLLNQFSVITRKIQGLNEMLSETGGEKMILDLVKISDLSRSVYHSEYLDKEDEIVRDNVSFVGIPEVLHVLFMLVSACTGIPLTRLFGISPAGMNSTGESDKNNYYDRVRSRQNIEAGPIMLRLVRIIAKWKNLPEPYVRWKALQQLSQKEQAEVDKIKADTEHVKAQTYQAYINAGIMEPYQARYLQFGDTLDKIPVPEGELLPPVQTLPDDNETGDNPDESGEDSNAEDDPANKEGKKNNKQAPENNKGVK